MNSSILFSRLPLFLALGLVLLAPALPALAQTRVKDVAVVQGRRDNQLVGMGIVDGLAGQGDSDPLSTQQIVSNFMRNFGINVLPQNIKAKNTAVVSVTGLIRGGQRNGSKFDVVVSSMSDSKSLQGGTLMPTQLFGLNKVVYAVAQGPLSIGGFLASGSNGGAAASLQKNHPTVGEIPDGAIVEREIPTDYFNGGVLEISLREGDFTSAVRMANAINEQIAPIAEAVSSSTVRIFVPQESRLPEKQLEFIARVENVIFRPDLAARIVMNEKTGTIVANSRIKIDSVAVAHGNLTVSVVNGFDVSQPNPLTGNSILPGVLPVAQIPLLQGGNPVYYDPASGNRIVVPQGQQPPAGYQVAMQQAAPPAPEVTGGGAGGGNGVALGNGPSTAVTPTSNVAVNEQPSNLVVFNDLPTVQDVAAALNALGVTPRDMMAIFQEMKEAGALQAELIVH